jgi:hypothetical protein
VFSDYGDRVVRFGDVAIREPVREEHNEGWVVIGMPLTRGGLRKPMAASKNMARPGGYAERQRRHITPRTANSSLQLGGTMSERMEEEMVAPIDGSEEIDEVTKKPMADNMGDSMGKEMKEPMEGDMDDSAEKPMRKPMEGDMDDLTEKPMREPRGSDMNDSTEMP